MSEDRDERKDRGDLWARLAAEMRAARVTAGIRLVDWAKKAGWHHSHLSNVEHGRTKASEELAKAYDDAFSPLHDPARLQSMRAAAAAADEQARRDALSARPGGTAQSGAPKERRARKLFVEWPPVRFLLVSGFVVLLALLAGALVVTAQHARKPRASQPTPCRSARGESNGAALPSGWHAIGDATVSPGDIPGSICLHSDQLYWAGIYNPTVPGCDYTFSADGRVLAEDSGWGIAARVNAAADGHTLTGHGLQYQNTHHADGRGYRDVDYPSDYGTLHPHDVDTGWHHLSETVRGDYYMLIVDGQKITEGSLSYWDSYNGPQSAVHHQVLACGGALVRMWSGGTVELKNLTITRD